MDKEGCHCEAHASPARRVGEGEGASRGALGMERMRAVTTGPPWWRKAAASVITNLCDNRGRSPLTKTAAAGRLCHSLAGSVGCPGSSPRT
jgi:hypothetical protein